VSAAVTASRACEVCGDPLTCRRADSRFCSNACRQEAYRRRLNRQHVQELQAAAERAESNLPKLRRAWFELEKDERLRTRAWLIEEIERRRAERLRARNRSLAERPT
jgi:predicted nucleic acid-binding Zn ribbon protein